MLTPFINQAKALSDPNRVRILAALRDRELCVCRIIELLRLAPSTVSKHLTILKQAGLVEGRKEGRWMHYQLSVDPTDDIQNTLQWMFGSLASNPEILTDQKRLEQIVKIDIEELTEIYKK